MGRNAGRGRDRGPDPDLAGVGPAPGQETAPGQGIVLGRGTAGRGLPKRRGPTPGRGLVRRIGPDPELRKRLRRRGGRGQGLSPGTTVATIRIKRMAPEVMMRWTLLTMTGARARREVTMVATREKRALYSKFGRTDSFLG